MFLSGSFGLPYSEAPDVSNQHKLVETISSVNDSLKLSASAAPGNTEKKQQSAPIIIMAAKTAPIPVPPPTPKLPIIFEHIAKCESGGRQFNPDGSVLRGVHHPPDIGKFQINSAVWGDLALKLGHDIFTEEGNEAMAYVIYKRQGLQAWQASQHCWDTAYAYRTTLASE